MLVGAKINLLNNPIFKGENGVVAEDGNEPIVPFIVEIKKNNLVLVRSCPQTSEYNEFPFKELQAFGIVIAPGQIAHATGIYNIRQYLDSRIAELKKDMQNETNPTTLDNILRRIALLESSNSTRYFGAMMPYSVPLSGNGSISDPDKQLTTEIDMDKPWMIDFWMGGWDPDAACGFVEGFVAISEK